MCIRDRYETRLKENRLIDFDDMLSYTYELFKERPDILALWQNKYKYIDVYKRQGYLYAD